MIHGFVVGWAVGVVEEAGAAAVDICVREELVSDIETESMEGAIKLTA